MKITLVGNYAPDRQQSMLRYATMLYDGLAQAGHEVRLVLPTHRLSRAGIGGLRKWIGYLDKFVLTWPDLHAAQRDADIVHICDHSNAMYVPGSPGRPHVVTCHDLLAVRGALGENTDCPATVAGKLLQQWILRGLNRAQAVASVSQATQRDAERLMPGYAGRLAVVPNALNHPYRQLDAAIVQSRLASLPQLPTDRPFVINIGSNLRRKNREVLVDMMARLKPTWPGVLVMAGEGLSPALRAQAERLGVLDRIVEVRRPDNDLLEALYNAARALVFPSRFEGFGWPIVEAHACGCPVICADRDPMREVAAGGALLCGVDDEEGYASATLALSADAALRSRLVEAGLRNAAAHSVQTMVTRLEELYRELLERT